MHDHHLASRTCMIPGTHDADFAAVVHDHDQSDFFGQTEFLRRQ